MISTEKIFIIIILFFGVLFILNTIKHGKSYPPHHSEFGTAYTKITELPDEYHPKHRGKELVLVWKHKRYSFMYVPFGGSTKGHYSLYQYRNPLGGLHYNREISLKKAQSLASTMNITIPTNTPPISFFSLYWGWILAFGLGALIYWENN